MKEKKETQNSSENLEQEVLESLEEKQESVMEGEVVAETKEEVVESKPEPIYTMTNISKFDYKTMKYCNLYIIKYQRKSFLIYLVMALITLGIGVWTLVDAISNNGSYLFPIIFVIFAAYMVYQSFSIEKALDRQLVSYFYNKKVSEQVVDINEEKMRVTRVTDAVATDPVVVDWIQVTEIVELPEYYYLFLGKNTPLILEKSEEAMTKGSLFDLKELVDEKAKAKPYKKIEKDIAKRPVTYVHQEVVATSSAEESVTEVSSVNDAVEAEVVNDAETKDKE